MATEMSDKNRTGWSLTLTRRRQEYLLDLARKMPFPTTTKHLLLGNIQKVELDPERTLRRT
ncbi:hypothetical protein KIN20_012359 [Parelaphostrongylus tenuis]|uniref:Uncharacterized protein n=1 Tax=Parelaphostrongylus tenuis TaxID=148309 RepID=A0AAD5QMR6_PARTN|nr:hypothetical protein KIN20_012359 [Parelaphostrongylus tenuis]